MRRKTYEDKYVIRNKNLPTVFANGFNHSRVQRHNIECMQGTPAGRAIYVCAAGQGMVFEVLDP